ncbi:hypothetical protein Tco_0838465 [Tanacetum coccineum]|uniref:Uncharacterized protein n=1 Tax=Tanacetum coccineum TaxID=301880 RepID=A0ABQ5ARW8_9ASTR
MKIFSKLLKTVSLLHVFDDDGRLLLYVADNDRTMMEDRYFAYYLNLTFIQGLIYFVGIKRLHDDLEVTAAKLMLLVYKLLLLVLEVNAASTKVTTAQRSRLLKEFLLSRDG